MRHGSLLDAQRHHFSIDDLTRQWVGRIGLAAVVGLGYFLTAVFSHRLLVKPDGMAVFWPAAGKDRLDGIFTAFVSTKPHGMGLGLAISRMIIEYHGGKRVVGRQRWRVIRICPANCVYRSEQRWNNLPALTV